MSWRDFFYFSKGERKALILLLCLITIAGIILFLTNSPSTGLKDTGSEMPQQTIPETSVTKSDSQTATNPSTSAPSYSQPRQPQRESTSARIQRMTSSQSAYPRTEKFSPGTIIELNAADTTILKKIPGIGSAFANRIVRYRDLLGGYYTVQQLAEVYGIDEERYAAFEPWFSIDDSFVRKLPVNTLIQDSLSRHPYISYRQARAIIQLRTQKKQLSGWENLALLDEFTEDDKNRLLPYLSFE
jgi:DNA uptake protein ComE-like DNA-binding protein